MNVYKPTMPEGLSVGLMGQCVSLDGKDKGTFYHFEIGLTDDEDHDPWVYLWDVDADGWKTGTGFNCNPRYFAAHFRWARHGQAL